MDTSLTDRKYTFAKARDARWRWTKYKKITMCFAGNRKFSNAIHINMTILRRVSARSYHIKGRFIDVI